MKIIFITLGEQSSGDMTIAVEFARRLNKKMHLVLFIAAERGKEILAALDLKAEVIGHDWPSRPKKNKAIIDAAFADFMPDLIIAGDIYTCEYSYEWTGLNLEGLIHYGLPIASFDQYEYFPANYTMDYYGGFKTKSPDLLSRCNFILRNCPPNRKEGGDEKRIFPVSLFGKVKKYTLSAKKSFLSELGGAPHAKTVFLASSNWESIDAFRFPALFRFITIVPSVIFQLLADTGIELTVIHVGVQNWESSNKLSHRIRYRYYPNLLPATFELALASSDLFLTMNRISITLSKAVFLRVPTLLLVSRTSHRFVDGEDVFSVDVPPWFVEFCRYLRVAYPFEVFPFGWSVFLRKLFHQNDYTQSFLESDIFDYHNSMRFLKALLVDAGCREALQDRQDRYAQSIASVDEPDAVMEKIGLQIGLSRRASNAGSWSNHGQE